MSSVHKSLNKNLNKWYSLNYRDLPWRKTQDPFKVWISEIILQQTRVSQGLPYYEKFIGQFNNIYELAQSEEEEVLKLWQGLGYYSRARNMHACAKTVAEQFSGQFPKSYHELLKLKGIGKYTAAAISSICFDEKVPSIDGNVYRVISRLLGLKNDISSSTSFQIFFNATQELMPEKKCGDFNQAMMELGATICTTSKPACHECPLSKYCFAYSKNLQSTLPVKSKKIKVKTRSFNYHFIQHEERILISKRTMKDIWQGLYEFFLIEGEPEIKLPFIGILDESTGVVKHQLTHQKLLIQFHKWIVERSELERIEKKFNMKSIDISEIGNFAVPKPIEYFLKNEKLLVNS